MNKLNTLRDGFEPLEPRCLLNGAGASSLAFGPALVGNANPGADPRIVPTDIGGYYGAGVAAAPASGFGGVPGNGAGLREATAWSNESVPPAQVAFMNTDATAGIFRAAAAIASSHAEANPVTPATGGELYPLGEGEQTALAVDYVLSLHEAAGNYSEMSGAMVGPEAMPEMMVPALYKRAPTAPATVAEDITAPKATAVPISQPQMGKGDGLVTGLLRDPVTALASKTPATPIVMGKEERLPGSLTDIPRANFGDRVQIGLSEFTVERRVDAAPTFPMNPHLLGRVSLGGTADGAVSFAPSDENAEAPCPLLTSVLPIDFASLEASIKEFFSQIDAAGLKLSGQHVNYLFSTGILAVAATLAVEVSRRQTGALAQAPALDCTTSIPYSDYP